MIVVAEWVPSSVKEMAQAFPLWGGATDQLLVHPRMEKVWLRLTKLPVTQEAIDRLAPLERLSTWGIPELGIALVDQAMAAFYARLSIEFGSDRVIATRAKATAFSKPWHDAAKLLRYELNCSQVHPELARALAFLRGAMGLSPVTALYPTLAPAGFLNPYS